MNPVELAQKIEERYRRYLKSTFYFKDPVLRASFEEALDSGHLRRGPFLEATPVFKRGRTMRTLCERLLGLEPDEAFLRAVQSQRPLYRHQEQAIQKVFEGRNAIVATGTGSGKTEAFLYPILLHLYNEFQAAKLDPGVRALILYPMNALANDQRDRLAGPPTDTSPPGVLWTLADLRSRFMFTFGQYIGETPEDENDTRRHARDHIANRLPGELVLRSEMRRTPPHILLTNYSMLEYLLLRPDDSPLFDNGQAKWWNFIVLDEAHQYRGSRGIEMAMLLRRLKQRLREGGRSGPFRCIATSATLAGGAEDRVEVAEFARALFDEEFHDEDVILGETEPIPEPSAEVLTLEDYGFLAQALDQSSTEVGGRLSELATRVGISPSSGGEITKMVGELLQHDGRAGKLRKLITERPVELADTAAQVFGELSNEQRVSETSALVALLLRAKDPVTDAPLLSARYHLFLRSLEGAFVSYSPEKKVYLDRSASGGEQGAFEVALCRECCCLPGLASKPRHIAFPPFRRQ